MTTPDQVEFASLKGRHVVDNAGTDVGAVEEVEINTRTWDVAGLVVKVRRDVADRLPLAKPLLGEPRVAVSTERIRSIGDNVLLNLSVSDIAAMLSESSR